MSAPLQNVWHVRTVAEASSKSCYICHKPSMKVLITPDNKDFFYVCASHLIDRGFASPIIDREAEEAKQKKEALDREIAKVTAEYEEKQKKKKSKKKKDKNESKDKKEEDDDKKDERERDEKIESITASKETAPTKDEGPRTYALQKNFYQMRIDRLRNIEVAKRNQQRMKDPGLFPVVPKGDIS